MKNPEKTAKLVMICIVSLVAAYGLGECIKEINASKAKAKQNKILIQEIKKLESAPSGETNQDTAFANMQNRDSRNGFTRDMQNDPRNGSTMNRQGGFNRGGMFGDSAAMGMGTRNIDQQSRASTALSDNQDTRKAVEDPNNSNVQGGR